MGSLKRNTSTNQNRRPARYGPERNGRSLFTDRQWPLLARSLGLSNREFQIIQGIFDDRTEAWIARELGISAHTVHSYLKRIYQKLRVSGRPSLILRVFAEYLSQPSLNDK